MTQTQKRDYITVQSAVRILSATCAGSEEKIIDMLTGYLWGEEEAGILKNGVFDLCDISDVDWSKE